MEINGDLCYKESLLYNRCFRGKDILFDHSECGNDLHKYMFKFDISLLTFLRNIQSQNAQKVVNPVPLKYKTFHKILIRMKCYEIFWNKDIDYTNIFSPTFAFYLFCYKGYFRTANELLLTMNWYFYDNELLHYGFIMGCYNCDFQMMTYFYDECKRKNSEWIENNEPFLFEMRYLLEKGHYGMVKWLCNRLQKDSDKIMVSRFLRDNKTKKYFSDFIKYLNEKLV